MSGGYILSTTGKTLLITDETPTGNIDGSNKDFTVFYGYRAGSIEVYLNGQKQIGEGIDYTETSNTTFWMVGAPLSGDVIRVTYRVY